MKRIALVLLLAAGCGSDAMKGPDWDLVTRHVWIDHLPRSETEMARSLVILDHDHVQIGVAVEASQWRAVVDGFKWSKTVGGADIRFPQTGKRASWTVKAWRCKDAPEPFELCLVVVEGAEHRRYYSKRDWVVGDHDRPVDAVLARIAALHAVAE